jgi:hypothetical protein
LIPKKGYLTRLLCLSELGPRYFILHALSFPYELICDILEIRGERRGFVKSTSEEKKMIEEGEEREREGDR